jgi:hypothetical protein
MLKFLRLTYRPFRTYHEFEPGAFWLWSERKVKRGHFAFGFSGVQ